MSKKENDIRLDRADVVVSPSTFRFTNYKKLLHTAEMIQKRYTGLHFTITTYKGARQLRTKLNKLDKGLNRVRLQYRKAYEKPYLQFKKQVDTIRSHIQSARDDVASQVKDINGQLKDDRADELKPLVHQICSSRGIPDMDVPKSCLKKSMTKQQRIKALSAVADETRVNYIEHNTKPVGDKLIDTNTGEIMGASTRIELRINDSEYKVKPLMDYLDKHHVHYEIKKE